MLYTLNMLSHWPVYQKDPGYSNESRNAASRQELQIEVHHLILCNFVTSKGWPLVLC